MNHQHLIDKLCSSAATALPARADIVALRQLTRNEVQTRVKRFLTTIHEAGICPQDRASAVDRGDRSIMHLPEGARAVVYHASGALHYTSGLAPLEAPFSRLEESGVLVRQLGEAAQRLGLPAWADDGSSLAFERLWQTKAQGADREQRVSNPLLVRATGAWRHVVAGIPVLGAASAALTLAGDGRIDALAVNTRPLSSETLDSAAIIAPELAARQIIERLIGVLGRAKEPLPPDVIDTATLVFGYLDTGKRKTQRLLAPVFLAQIALKHRFERQACIIAVHATERPYFELPLFGHEAVITRARDEHCKPEIA